MTTDAIALSTAQIKAKASALKSTYKPLTSSTMRIPDLKIKDRAALPTSERAKYLQSINASGLKEAAAQLGLKINFGLDAKAWLDKNPAVKAQLDQITALAAEITKSKALTAQAVTTTGSDA